MLKDIQSRQDVVRMINHFCDKVDADLVVSPLFSFRKRSDKTEQAGKMIRFWSTLLLGEMGYLGSPFPHHINGPIKKMYFDRWLFLFNATLDELFNGEKADEARQVAADIARVFEATLILEEEGHLSIA